MSKSVETLCRKKKKRLVNGCSVNGGNSMIYNSIKELVCLFFQPLSDHPEFE